MILLSLGTQDFQFERLLREIDRLIETGVIKEEVFAQIGYNDYKPRHYAYRPFTDFQEFDALLQECSFLITHGGTGTIVGGLKKGKKIIAVPRLKKYNEHVDDHQLEIIGYFSENKLIIGLDEVEELETAIHEIESFHTKKFVSGNEKIIGLIDALAKQIE
ncbi:beta-1,4-galactosyltransferase [Paenibacillus baekrokdamisoli]|uniref:Beta-1,4-galactosyltransferase n=1 Tax=Paenibacillus baekrokdamisoli TaxID=1712516 RepID=A0A3G9IWT3_9BACL|nr:PssE/Cps14G family polysaccharide biosynthesis glycosyltransferase [Paenibacillus baekrokdamisoli]MBB3067976.1 UDP-N-acetylglucosamine transferase subunit ALG13 [Paenibacillus baekrokdamisoli]BBH22976.1 beta-1,4-galactosyltransferase [Paenibacillus baekrokdamisoli]